MVRRSMEEPILGLKHTREAALSPFLVLIWQHTEQGWRLGLNPASRLPWGCCLFRHGSKVSVGIALGRPDRSCGPRPVLASQDMLLLLPPDCQAVKIKIRHLDSRALCDCPNFFSQSR